MNDEILTLETTDDIDRRGFLKCMAWTGTGVLFGIVGGIPKSIDLSSIGRNPATTVAASRLIQQSSFCFVQISDSHIGYVISGQAELGFKEIQGFHVLSWGKGGLTYVEISDASIANLQLFQESYRAKG